MLITDRTFNNLKRNVDRALEMTHTSYPANDMMIGRVTAPLLLDISELEMLSDILDKAPDQTIEDKLNANKELCFILLSGTDYGEEAYFQDDGTFSQRVECKLFNRKQDAEELINENNILEAANSFCKRNHWSLRRLKVISCKHSLETFICQTRLSKLDLDFLSSMLITAINDVGCHGPEENPFYAQALRNVINEFTPIFAAFAPEAFEHLQRFLY